MEDSSVPEQPAVPVVPAEPGQPSESEIGGQDFDIDVQEKKLEERASNMKIEEPTADWSMSEGKRKQIMFEEGDFQISADWSPGQAKQKVDAYINDLSEERLVNVFDTSAPRNLQDEIAEASSKDESLVMSKEIQKTFEELIRQLEELYKGGGQELKALQKFMRNEALLYVLDQYLEKI